MNPRRPVIGITTDIKDSNFVIEDAYGRAVAKSGGIPLLIPSLPENRKLLEDAVSRIDGLLLPGSRDMDPKFYNEVPHPKLRPMSIERTEAEFILLDEALKREMPVLGICGGMQLLNVFYGGSLYQDIVSFLPNAITHEKGAVHEIDIEGGTLLLGILGAGRLSVKSYHHQAVKAVGSGMTVSAHSPDGIVEGIESSEYPFVIGIQWHPEREDSEYSDRIFRSFIEECGGE